MLNKRWFTIRYGEGLAKTGMSAPVFMKPELLAVQKRNLFGDSEGSDSARDIGRRFFQQCRIGTLSGFSLRYESHNRCGPTVSINSGCSKIIPDREKRR